MMAIDDFSALSDLSLSLGEPIVKTMQTLTSDPRPLEEFKPRATNIPAATLSNTTPRPRVLAPDTNRLDGHVFEWDHRTGPSDRNITSVSNLESLESPAVRVFLLPRDDPTSNYANGLVDVFERFSIPSAFIAESLQDVSQSFAARTDEDGAMYLWFHLLSKDLQISQGDGRHRIVRQHFSLMNHGDQCATQRSAAQGSQQAARSVDDSSTKEDYHEDFTWMKPGFVLKFEGEKKSSGLQSRSTSDSSGSIATLTNETKRVTLLCFGAPYLPFLERFELLKNTASCKELLLDPYILLEVVFEVMHELMDDVGWRISDIFGPYETNILRKSSRPGQAGKDIKFAALHNLQKHAIYLRENFEAALCTLESICKRHEKYIGKGPTTLQMSTQEALEYRKTMFLSTQRRLASLDERMANILQLSFNLVTQRDSRVMQSEALSMKMIAVVTLIFMPLSTVASVFGTQLIRLEDEKPFHMRVSQDFWLLWIIAGPLTILVILLWRVWYRDEKAQLRDEGTSEPRPQGKHSYMGWRSVKEKVENKQSERRRSHAHELERLVRHDV